MRTVLVKNGIIVDSGALRALGILIAGDRAPHGTPGVETPFGVTWDEGINRGAHRRHGFRQEHEPESDADMVLVDPGWPRTVPERNPHLVVGSSIFMGRQCLGGPVTVLRRGKSSANAAKSREPFPAASSPRAHPKGLTHHLPSLSGTRRNIGRGLLPLPNIRIYLFEKTE